MNSLLQAQVAYPAEPAQQDPQERLLKAGLQDIYYGESLMECYHFWQQREDHLTPPMPLALTVHLL